MLSSLSHYLYFLSNTIYLTYKLLTEYEQIIFIEYFYSILFEQLGHEAW